MKNYTFLLGASSETSVEGMPGRAHLNAYVMGATSVHRLEGVRNNSGYSSIESPIYGSHPGLESGVGGHDLSDCLTLESDIKSHQEKIQQISSKLADCTTPPNFCTVEEINEVVNEWEAELKALTDAQREYDQKCKTKLSV